METMAGKIIIAARFYAWRESERIAICFSFDGEWFPLAINCSRDGDMGDEDENGIYARAWASDWIHPDEGTKVRYATKGEADIFMEHEQNWWWHVPELHRRPDRLIYTPEYVEAQWDTDNE
jgi:hypothetical protein